jgi:site-specific DNA-methyltransferase (adenine-specific)
MKIDIYSTDKKYNIIYADPPWSYNDKMSGHSFSLEHEYETMPLEWIKSLPVAKLAEKDCILFLWAISPQLPEAIEVMQAWGFAYKTVAFCWSKVTKNKKPVSNLGKWTMGNVELCLLGVRGKPNKFRVDKGVKQLVVAERTIHSKKPDEVRERITQGFGDLPRIELFARQAAEGWDCWGNEAPESVQGGIV